MKIPHGLAGVLTLGLIALLAPGRTQADSVSLQAELLKDWLALKYTMHKIAAEMPAEKYDFRPTPGQQTFGERMIHVAVVNVSLLGSLGSASKPAIDPKATSKESALKALDESFDYGAGLIREQTDKTLLEPAVSAPKFLGSSSHARVIAFLMGHTWDTYGQAAVYLRLNGRVPPASQRM